MAARVTVSWRRWTGSTWRWQWLRIRFEERDGFLSDSDILRVADMFTVSVLPARTPSEAEESVAMADTPSWSRCLYAACQEG